MVSTGVVKLALLCKAVPPVALAYQLKVTLAGAVALSVVVCPLQMVAPAAVGVAGVGFTFTTTLVRVAELQLPTCAST